MDKKNDVIKVCKNTKAETLAGCDQHSLENKRHYFLTIENHKQHFKARTIESSQNRPPTAIERLEKFQRVRDKNLKLARSETAVGRTREQASMALEIETVAAVDRNGTDREQVEDESEESVTLNEMKEQIHLSKLNNAIEPVIATLNGQGALENGHSDANKLQINDSPKSRGKRSKKRSAKSTPSKSKKKTLADYNAVTDDDNRSENSSSIFSKDTEDECSIVVVTDDFDASAEFVDISLALTPEPVDEEIDVEDLEESSREADEEKTPPAVAIETTILSSLRERIRFSLSPKKPETKVEVKETPVVSEINSIYKGISGRRPLRSPYNRASEEGKSVFKQTESLGDDACLKRKADQDTYSFQSKKIRSDSSGWNFYPFKWFTSSKTAECNLLKSTPRKLHDEIEEMVVEEAASEVAPEKQTVEKETTVIEEQKKASDESGQADKVAEDPTKSESVSCAQDENSTGKTWANRCSVM